MQTLTLSADAVAVTTDVLRSLDESDALLARLRSTGDLVIGSDGLEQRARYEVGLARSRAAFARWAEAAAAELNGFDDDSPLVALSRRFANALVRESRSL